MSSLQTLSCCCFTVFSTHSHFVQRVNMSRVDSLLMSAACVFITLTDFPDIVWCLCVKEALFSHPGGSVKHHRAASWES